MEKQNAIRKRSYRYVLVQLVAIYYCLPKSNDD